MSFSRPRIDARRRDLRAAFGTGHDVSRPVRWRAPIVFASPHSGAVYPKGFRRASARSLRELRRNEDAFVDRLFAAAPLLGAPLVRAHFPRCFVDVNRAGDDLPPEWLPLDHADRPGPARLGPRDGYRAKLGLGVVPLIISENLPIYRHPPGRDAVQARLDALYWPYHETLGGLLRLSRERFGRALLVDCHSMPGHAVDRRGAASARPDIVLGDGHGRTARPRTVDRLHTAFERRGYNVVRNHPYAGGFATLNYGRPDSGVEAVQIEINRDLYLNADTLTPREGFADLESDLTDIMDELIAALATGDRGDRDAWPDALPDAAE